MDGAALSPVRYEASAWHVTITLTYQSQMSYRSARPKYVPMPKEPQNVTTSDADCQNKHRIFGPVKFWPPGRRLPLLRLIIIANRLVVLFLVGSSFTIVTSSAMTVTLSTRAVPFLTPAHTSGPRHRSTSTCGVGIPKRMARWFQMNRERMQFHNLPPADSRHLVLSFPLADTNWGPLAIQPPGCLACEKCLAYSLCPFSAHRCGGAEALPRHFGTCKQDSHFRHTRSKSPTQLKPHTGNISRTLRVWFEPGMSNPPFQSFGWFSLIAVSGRTRSGLHSQALPPDSSHLQSGWSLLAESPKINWVLGHILSVCRRRALL